MKTRKNYKPLMFKIGLIVIFFSFLLSQAVAQTDSAEKIDPNKKFSQEQLQSDFLVFRKILEESHASIYRYISAAALNHKFDSVFLSISNNMTELEFYSLLTYIISAIKDGHMYSFLSKEYRTFLSQKATFLPVSVRFINGRAYVIESTTTAIIPGDELLAINGRTITEIINLLFDHIIADGDITTGKYWKLNRRFGYFYYLFIEQATEFKLEFYSRADKKKRTILVPALSQADFRNQVSTKASPLITKKPLRLEIIKSRAAALLTLETFDDGAITEAGLDFSKFLDSSFRVIKFSKIKNLILDLRSNDGGNNYGGLLYSYLSEKPFRFIDYIESSTSDLKETKNYTSLDTAFLKKYQTSLIPSGNGRFRVKPESDSSLKELKSHKNHYSNKLWILTNGETFSATTMFCSIVKSNGRGKFVGEETGGGYAGNSAGEFIVITLPETKIKVAVGLEKFVMAINKKYPARRGVIPNISIQPDINSVLSNYDTQLNYIFNLIK